MQLVKLNSDWTLVTQTSSMIQLRSNSHETVEVFLGDNPVGSSTSFLFTNNQVFSTTDDTKVWARCSSAAGVAIVKEA